MKELLVSPISRLLILLPVLLAFQSPSYATPQVWAQWFRITTDNKTCISAVSETLEANGFVAETNGPVETIIGPFTSLGIRYNNDEKGIGILAYCSQSGGFGAFLGTGNNRQFTTETFESLLRTFGKKYFGWSDKEAQDFKL